MAITISYRLDEELVIKLLDYYRTKDEYRNLPLTLSKGALLSAIVKAHYKSLVSQNLVSDKPLDLKYLTDRCREEFFTRKSSGQVYVSSKKLRERQQAAMKADYLEMDKDLGAFLDKFDLE